MYSGGYNWQVQNILKILYRPDLQYQTSYNLAKLWKLYIQISTPYVCSFQENHSHQSSEQCLFIIIVAQQPQISCSELSYFSELTHHCCYFRYAQYGCLLIQFHWTILSGWFLALIAGEGGSYHGNLLQRMTIYQIFPLIYMRVCQSRI